jgi:hypothetical protein
MQGHEIRRIRSGEGAKREDRKGVLMKGEVLLLGAVSLLKAV